MKIILFDLGGVLVPEKWHAILEEMAKFLNITKEEIDAMRQKHSDEIRAGKLTLKEAYTNLLREKNSSIDPSDALQKHMGLFKQTSVARDPQILQLIEQLKKNYRVGCLTNTEVEVGEFNKTIGLFDYFDPAFLSTELGIGKPHVEIYNKVVGIVGCNVEDIIFIDNDKSYIAGAQKAGWDCILYKNVEQLKEELKKRNIEF